MKSKFTILSQLVLISLLLISLLGSMLLLPLVQPTQDRPLQNEEVKDWTYMVYLDADNNLDSYGIEDRS